ncbi:MAG: hypothetical protein Q7R70_04640 [Candidatus Diapherotrites archaeon]|nr:hypothetical protein [Candidatus Diapherotrites archaeon]
MPKKKKPISRKPAAKSKPSAVKKKHSFESLHALSKTSAHKINASKISTSELEKMRDFGILPFELRKELYRRNGKK